MFSIEVKRVEVAVYCMSNTTEGKQSFTLRGGMKYCGFDWKNNRKKEEPLVSNYKNRASELYLYDFLEGMPFRLNG